MTTLLELGAASRMLRYARERVARWLHPTIPVPVYAPVAGPPEYELDKVPTDQRLAAICGYRSGDVMVIVSPSGLHVPLASPSAVRVVEVASYLGWVGGLPEIEPGSRRA